MPSRMNAGSRGTLPMTVKNTGFLLDRLGEDCHPLQHLRELTTNSIEAILRTGSQTGEIVWDVDWITYELEAFYKLCITDNGVGMTGQEMVEYINQLSSSVAQQSLSGNYGVGAKIATATRNHEGVVYLSWKGGQGEMIHFWRDPTDGTYGLKRFESTDGGYHHYIGIEDEVKQPPIANHGTKIVLLGNSAAQDTMHPPTPDTPSPSRWISKYLNTRYFRFPNGIVVRAREGWENPRSDKDRNTLRTITGQEQYLKSHASANGIVELNGVRAHWWVLRDEPAISNNSGYIESAGHVAALYQDELYEMTTARSGMARLQNFGVIFGYRQVVIYVEPLASDSLRVTTNTARTMLLINNEPLPWSEWAAEFRERIPDPIAELVAEKAANASSPDHMQSIRDRLKQIIDLFKVSRYRPAPSGSLTIDDQTTTRGGQAKRDRTHTQGDSGSAGGEGGKAGGVYAIFQKEGGTPGERIQPDIFPMVDWISIKDGTRESGMLEDRAARFLADQNRLQINADFRVFNDMISKFLKDLGGNPAFTDRVTDAVHGWFEQTLVETVIGVQALRNAKEWTLSDIQTALSEEALTAAVMPRYHVHNAVKRELHSKLGKPIVATA